MFEFFRRRASREKETAGSAPAPAASTHFELALQHLKADRREAALHHFTEAVQADPSKADALCMIGVILHDLQRDAEAIPYYQRAIELQPGFSEAFFNLGLAQFECGLLSDASRSFSKCNELRRGKAWQPDPAAHLAREPLPRFEPMDMGVNEVKLQHDVEQFEYLLAGNLLPAPFAAVLDEYRALLEEMRGRTDPSMVVAFDALRFPLVARTYKRPVLVWAESPPEGPLVNPELDFEALQDSYRAARPEMVTLDGLLTAPALDALRRFCRNSTIWNNVKTGYLGAYFYDGFCCELLLRIAAELRERMPRVIGGLPLQMMWGFKCDSALPGLAVHADQAAVNVNFWITEESANADPQSGGLLVYEHDAPAEWGFAKYNHDPQPIVEYLQSVGSVPVRIPYRENRAVIFDSDLFHATDQPRFRPGYLNRRINVTLLYGNRVVR